MRILPLLVATLALSAMAPVGASTTGTPDLVVTSLWHENPSSHNQTLWMSVTVENQGNASAGAFTLGLSIPSGNMSFERTVRVAGLAAGAAQTFTFNTTTVEGEHTLHAVADVWSEVAESNEANNARTSTLQVYIPDLTPRELWMTPVDPLPGEKVFFHAHVANWGLGYATDTLVRFRVMNGPTFTEKTLAYLGAQAATDVTSYTYVWTGSPVSICVILENPDEIRLGATNGRCEEFRSELPL